ncbi:MAG: porin family protein, partial [Segetibacter sp.]
GKVGANLTKITGQAFKDGYDLGYHVGVFAEIDVNKKWGIQPEVLWNQTNTQRASGTSAPLNNWQQNTNNIKLNYLSIPILLRYNVGSLITLNAGPQFAILMNKNESLWANGKEAFKSGDLSLVGGATVNLKVFRVYGRYNIGLNNLNDVGTQDKWKSQQLQLGVGISL